jgi:hypothetical protein
VKLSLQTFQLEFNNNTNSKNQNNGNNNIGNNTNNNNKKSQLVSLATLSSLSIRFNQMNNNQNLYLTVGGLMLVDKRESRYKIRERIRENRGIK